MLHQGKQSTADQDFADHNQSTLAEPKVTSTIPEFIRAAIKADNETPLPFSDEELRNWLNEGIHAAFCPRQDVQVLIREECSALADFLVQKNAAYGNSFADPINIFSKSNPMEQINIRIDDKLKRLMHGNEAAKQEVPEDTELDLIGYLILKRVLRRMVDGPPL